MIIWQHYLNGHSIKFRGVNRHDSDPITGPVISLEHMKRDLRMIKEFNFNAIRTAHYPNAPMFYQLCDQYGFMVIDEADHESHGAAEMYCSENELWENHVEHWNEPFADNPDFLEATLDRTKRCVIRDKNRPCVICWSMGNESAYGCCFEAALDLRNPTPIGEHINDNFHQLIFARGYDHNYVLDGEAGKLHPVAQAYGSSTGITMRAETTLPGVHFYTANYLPEGRTGKGGCTYAPRHGFCLETQFFPDAPNQPTFPSTVLQAGDKYEHTTIFSFSTQ